MRILTGLWYSLIPFSINLNLYINMNIRYCDVCGVSSEIKNVWNSKEFGMCLCEKHKILMKKYGKVLDHNPRCVFDPNEIRELEEYCEIDTYDQQGNVKETYIFDKEDIEYAKNFKWRTVYKDVKTISKPYLVTGNQKSQKEYFHRLVMGNPENMVIDHINGNTLDNRKQNLRIITGGENQQNMKKKIDNTSGIRGISFDKQEQRWKCDFTYRKKRFYFKKWDKIEQAVYLRYLCEITFQKTLRHTSNDELIMAHINKLSNAEKEDILKYFNSKINTSKEGV